MRKTLIILLVTTLCISCTQKEEKTYNIGQKSLTLVDESRDRPLLTEIWYPTFDEPTETAREKRY